MRYEYSHLVRLVSKEIDFLKVLFQEVEAISLVPSFWKCIYAYLPSCDERDKGIERGVRGEEGERWIDRNTRQSLFNITSYIKDKLEF